MNERKREKTGADKGERTGTRVRDREALLLTVSAAARVLSIGRTTMYELFASGEVEVLHIGRAARVPVASIEEFVERRRRQRGTVRPRTSAARAKQELDPGQPTT